MVKPPAEFLDYSARCSTIPREISGRSPHAHPNLERSSRDGGTSVGELWQGRPARHTASSKKNLQFRLVFASVCICLSLFPALFSTPLWYLEWRELTVFIIICNDKG